MVKRNIVLILSLVLLFNQVVLADDDEGGRISKIN